MIDRFDTYSKFEQAINGAYELFSILKPITAQYQMINFEKALNLMFYLHHDQRRVGGQSYIDHTLLVAKVLVKKFGVVDMPAVIAALLHDAPEDQSAKIFGLFGESFRKTEHGAIKALSGEFGDINLQFEQHLIGLTNPDFKKLCQSINLKHKNSDPLAWKLYELGLNALIANEKAFKIEYQKEAIPVGNILYLGHWAELAEGSPLTFIIKLADFYSNGLHLHLFAKSIEEIEDADDRLIGEKKLEKLKVKYGPVVDYLRRIFSDERSGIVSPRILKVLRPKLEFAHLHGFAND